MAHLDYNGVPLAVDSIVRNSCGTEFGVISLITYPKPSDRHQEVVVFNVTHGVSAYSPHELVFIARRSDRVAQLGEALLLSRTEAVTCMHGIQTALMEDESWDHDLAHALRLELVNAQKLTQELRALDPTSDYLSR